MDRLSALIVTRSRLARAVAALEGHSVAVRELQTIVQENARQLRDLRGALLRIRMVPFAEVLSRLPLILRGIRRTSGKEVRLETRAADAELDKAVAERIFPALVHLVRNAVDHGMGTREERLRQGKKAEGTVSILCSARSNRYLAIEVIDDGRGVDREALARATGSEVPAGDVGLLEVLCRPGLSTRTEATTTSGRGMGMDIVRKIVVEQLGGDLSIQSRAGEGTTFTLQIPLTVSILDAFTVQCGPQRFTVPVAIVEEIVELDQRKVTRGPGGKGGEGTALIERRGETIPLVDLAHVLGLGRESPVGLRQALVVRRGIEPVAFGLDRVLSQQETVVRPLVDPLVQAPGIAGSTDLGDGQPTLVLDLVAMVAALGRPSRGERGRAA
jgi:two-component system chemotaxis sensor kinase CheA